MNDKVWLPAQCLSAEMALIGGVLLDRDNAAFDDVSSIVSAEHFYDVRNQKIWIALSYLLRKGIQVDAVTLAEELQVRGWLGDVGGVLYLAAILEIVPHSSHSEIYARMVREKADERNARYALTEAVRALDNGGIDLHDIIGEVDSRLLELLAPSGADDDAIS